MINILKAQKEDLKDILQVQYAAFHSEGILHNNFKIQPLTQTLDEVIEEFNKGVILKAVEDSKIIGSIRAQKHGNIIHIAKLVVHPERQGNGLGKRLLAAVENEFPNCKFELYTSCMNSRNLHIYESSGYTRFKEEIGDAGLRFAYFQK